MTEASDLYCYVDSAVGGWNHRNRIVDWREFHPSPDAVDAGCTYFRYAADILEHVRTHKSIRGYTGPVYTDRVPIDLDRDGDLAGALFDARALIEHCAARWDIEGVRVHFSGSKGFSLEIPSTYFGGFEPSPDLPVRLRRAVETLVAGSGVGSVDFSIYEPLRLWRAPNTVNSRSGLHKIPLTVHELLNVGADDIAALAACPRQVDVPSDDDWNPRPELVELWEATPTPPPREKKNIVVVATMPLGKEALDFVANGAPIGDQRNRAVKAARNYLSAGKTVDETGDAIWRGLQQSPWRVDEPWTYDEVLAIVEDLASKPAPPPPPLRYPMVPTSLPATTSAAGSEVPEATGAEIIDSAGDLSELVTLPLLGQSGYIVERWSTLLAGYPRSGKSELLVRCVAEWLGEGRTVLYATEEPRSLWEMRLRSLPQADWHNLHVVFGLGTDPDALFGRAFRGTETVVIIDTVRNLLRLRDENDNSEVARVLNPWVAQARQVGVTLIMAHHMRKGAGDHGEGIAGGHALLGAFDIALELVRDRNHQNRRLIRTYARLIAPPELAYERDESGTFRALGNPTELQLAEVRERVLDVLGEDWAKTKEIGDALGDPKPGDEQVRLALRALAQAGEAERDPDISVKNAQGNTHRWRRRTSLPAIDRLGGR